MKGDWKSFLCFDPTIGWHTLVMKVSGDDRRMLFAGRDHEARAKRRLEELAEEDGDDVEAVPEA